MFEKRGTELIVGTSKRVGEGLTLEEIVQAFVELTLCPDQPSEDDFVKILILHAFKLADEDGRNGLTAPEVVEMLIGRELTEEEEDYVILHTEAPAGHA